MVDGSRWGLMEEGRWSGGRRFSIVVRRGKAEMEKREDAGQCGWFQEVVCFQSVPYSTRGLEMLQVVLRGLPQFPAPARLG